MTLGALILPFCGSHQNFSLTIAAALQFNDIISFPIEQRILGTNAGKQQF